MRPAHGAESIIRGDGMQEEDAAAATTDDHGTPASTAAGAGKTVYQQLYCGAFHD
jgi:hypothetical protein